ncbi:hypothetical protein M407DRAFT_17876 [Tulasnella calospora MUT 4182]|uniref:Uncharacterized protein n=1 Tax=Tulasnella calospora MUT 4182 TaxID=1051891 RepID=A0A0C3QV14_9AGAM|nr:hypothetical protein M407DRAFT_17876 [Tulasnella calospora MUT 4182]
MALHLIFMPIQVSNFLLTTIHAPNCSELFISSHFPELPDDVVRERLFTSNAKHFSPVLKKLLTQGQYKDIDVLRFDDQSMEFRLQFHDEDFDYSVDRGILRLAFKLHSVGQVETTVQWLTSCFNRDMPKIPVRIFMDGLEEVHLVNLFDSHMAITHLAFRACSDPGAIQPNPILAHMAHPTPSGWPLPDLEVFSYCLGEEGSESHNEMMLDMLRRRYGPSPESGSERLPPRLLRRMRIVAAVVGGENSVYLLGEVQKILPQAETSLIDEEDSIW